MIVLPVTTFFLNNLYRDAVINLFDETLHQDLRELVINEELKQYLADLSSAKTGEWKEHITAPDRIDVVGGGQFNLLARQFHWQVTRLNSQRSFNVLAPSLKGSPLKLPSRDKTAQAGANLYTAYQKTPVPDEEGQFPRLRVLEVQYELGSGDKVQTYGFLVARDVSEPERNIVRFRTNLLIAFAALSLLLAV